MMDLLWGDMGLHSTKHERGGGVIEAFRASVRQEAKQVKVKLGHKISNIIATGKDERS